MALARGAISMLGMWNVETCPLSLPASFALKIMITQSFLCFQTCPRPLNPLECGTFVRKQRGR